MTSYAGEFFSLSYFDGWRLREDDGALSLWKSTSGGAITISTLLLDVEADARAHCERFAAEQGLDEPRMSGGREKAEAAFDLADGGWCRVLILARGSRLVFATYTTRASDAAEEDDVERIFATLALVG